MNETDIVSQSNIQQAGDELMRKITQMREQETQLNVVRDAKEGPVVTKSRLQLMTLFESWKCRMITQQDSRTNAHKMHTKIIKNHWMFGRDRLQTTADVLFLAFVPREKTFPEELIAPWPGT